MSVQQRHLVGVAVDPTEGQPAPTPRPTKGSRILRRLLVLFDIWGLASAWIVAMLLPASLLGATDASLGRTLLVVPAVSGASLVVMMFQRLYLARVSSVRAVEIAHLARTGVAAAVLALVLGEWLGVDVTLRRAAVGGLLTFVFLGGLRGVYGHWLRAGRTQGLFSRPVVIVGANAEGLALYRLVQSHPELGFRVCGVTGSRDEFARWHGDVPFLGESSDTLAAILSTGANGVIVAASSMSPPELNRLIRELLRTDVHVHLSSGLAGIAHRRVRPLPLAHEPLFYLERVTLSRWQFATKRALDLAVASFLLLLAAPMLLVAAVAIKVSSPGPVLFRQTRIGRNGEPFTVFKLRTMVVDAEKRLEELRNANERIGPLFKLRRDPRRTRVGRLLEGGSLDELPQLFNVLLGNMSLVGPRPALPEEVAQFDEELLVRLSVPPGITGLWQVEARDNPSFHAYKRLDLFYVENWSVTLDLAILFSTAQEVVVRLFHRR